MVVKQRSPSETSIKLKALTTDRIKKSTNKNNKFTLKFTKTNIIEAITCKINLSCGLKLIKSSTNPIKKNGTVEIKKNMLVLRKIPWLNKKKMTAPETVKKIPTPPKCGIGFSCIFKIPSGLSKKLYFSAIQIKK